MPVMFWIGGGDGGSKSNVNPKMVIDLSDEPETRWRRIMTVAEKEAETQHDQEFWNSGGKGKQVVKPLLDIGLGKKMDEGVKERKKVSGLGSLKEAPKDDRVGGVSLDSSLKQTRDETSGVPG
ncbi:hypothetical protein L1987_21098 [Smallanthus sonchifolius]|uniref:Uncharacterized protein n=1 Tax=Smallanthus sonchifolius TaxID=185202 RepID=A0ACB9IWI7_9ASTR|nr:hypothetical protein L1987_21098 [Smallanthus sonchifolius]